MKFNRVNLAWWIVFAVTAAFRLFALDLKPIHFDESINGWFVGQMWERGFYQYNPKNFHGPLYFYFLQISEVIFGFGLKSLRLVNVFFSLGIVVLLYQLQRIVGRRTLWAAALLAVSPAFVFYGRTAIHEMTFIFFQLLFLLGWIEWRCVNLRSGLLKAAFGMAGCLLLKETFIIYFIVFAIAWLLAALLGRWRGDRPKIIFRSYQNKRAELIIVGLSVAIILQLFYSGFMQNPQGMRDFFSAFTPWMKEGIESGHEKSFWYYLTTLYRFEDLIILALACVPLIVIIPSSRFAKFFALLGFGNFLAYSLIPYKTPWLVLNFIWPLALYYGDLIEQLWKFEHKGRLVARSLAVLLFGFLAISTLKSVHLNFVAYDDDKEPYVYVQTKRQAKWIFDYLDALAERDPVRKNMRIEVFSDSAWPLPYIFREWTDVHWNNKQVPAVVKGDVIFCDRKLKTVMEANLKGKYWRHEVDLRSGRQTIFVYLRDSEVFYPIAESEEWQLMEMK